MMDRPTGIIHAGSLNVGGLSSALRPLTERAAHFCGAIEECGIDVVNFQEVWGRHVLKAIRTHLPSFSSIAWRRGIAGQPAGGLVTFSRHPIGAMSYQSFRGIRPATGSFFFRATRALNSRIHGVLTVELFGGKVVVANVHLTPNKDGDWSPVNRHHAFQGAQLGVLHTLLRGAHTAETEVMVVAGDFNIASDGPLYPLITDGGAWRDPFAALNPTTFHAAFLPPGSSAHRIDYLLVSGDASRFRVADTRLMFTEPMVAPDGARMYLSDHIALTAVIESPSAR
jgi:exonuclease III